MVRHGIKVYRISLGQPYKILQGIVQPRSRVVALFPRGRWLLITDAVFLQSPKEVLRVFLWFQDLYKLKEPGTWKIFTRPKSLDWLIKVADKKLEKSAEAALPFQLLWKVWRELVPEDDRDEDDKPERSALIQCPSVLPGYHSSVDCADEAPDEVAKLSSNDEKLVDWFGKTSLNQIEAVRKFGILYDEDISHKSKPRWRAEWNHVSYAVAQII